MLDQRAGRVCALIGVLLMGAVTVRATVAPAASGLVIAAPSLEHQAEPMPVRHVYAPYNVPAGEAAVFWFGRVTSNVNYTDARIRYTDDRLLLSLGIMDRLLWYDTTPSPAEMTSWDSVSFYVSLSGATGEAPNSGTYRFDAQLGWWEDNFHVAYIGNGGGWTVATVPFTTTYGWNGNVPNNDSEDDRGWALYYAIPFTSLGLNGPPPQGTVWGLGLAVHDRDGALSSPLADQVWPETMDPLRPETWGRLVFGLKPAYVPDPTTPTGTTVIRHGLDGAQVIDADVGGSSICGGPAAPGFFPAWGNLNWAGKEFLNIQHVDPISEWPCFSKVYVTFPLGRVPAGKTILSATLTLYQNGNAGERENPGPQSSFIEVFTVDEDWHESTITWNNAPMAMENVAGTWVDPLPESPPWPGIPRQWDVSRAVAQAYAEGEPLRLVLYSPDWPMHSGKYFYSSDIGGGGEGRPTLTIAWGNPVATLTKVATPSEAAYDDVITYTLDLVGYGGPLTLTDTLPAGLNGPSELAWEGTSIAPTSDPSTHTLTWNASPPLGQQVILTYTAQVTTHSPAVLTNSAVLQGNGDIAAQATATVVVNPYRIALPLLLRSR